MSVSRLSAHAALILLSLVATSSARAQAPVEQGERNAPEKVPSFAEQTRVPEQRSGYAIDVEEVTASLNYPWGMARLPHGALLVTERTGALRVVDEEGGVSPPIAGLPPVHAAGQGGLLDVEVDPDFAENRLVYWSYAKPLDARLRATAAARGRLSEDLSRVEDVEELFVQEPGARGTAHFGSRLAFDEDNHLFITTGERSARESRGLAQELGSSFGKVIRLRPDGRVPPDNPYVGQDGAIAGIWTLGHRNVQGVAVHPESGELWVVEHGPKGGDEINLARAGLNFGWPILSYGVNYNGSQVGDNVAAATQSLEQPVYFWDPVIAPSGITFYSGDLFAEWQGDLLIASLNPGGLVRIALDEEADTPGGAPRAVGEEWLLRDVGRVRDVAVSGDGSVLVLTDGERGRLLRLTPQVSN